jgi:CBS domain-containing protein
MLARELMSTPVVTTYPEAPLKEVLTIMATHRVSGAPVVDRLGGIVGIISESDILRRLEFREKSGGLLGLLDMLAHAVGADQKLVGQTAADLMTTKVISAGPDASVREVGRLMTIYDINRVPIVEAGHVIGIVTRGDILRIFARPDTAISQEIQWKAARDLGKDVGALQISTRDGVVAIAGEIERRSDALQLERWARSTEGVVNVDVRALRYRSDDSAKQS